MTSANDTTSPGGVGGSGYDLEALSAYADRGRTPAIAAIDGNPECVALLDSIDRLGALTRDLVADDAAAQPAPDENWIRALLDTISREVRAGRDIPFPDTGEDARYVVTEGAIRQLLRETGDAVDGALVGRVGLRIVDETRAEVELSISVAAGRRLDPIAAAVRDRVAAALRRSTPLEPDRIDITIDDVHVAAPAATDTAAPTTAEPGSEPR
ncbi:Asp23/Gls24 family envelope stress response protein [Schumannella soli]|uniref:Asp23/Gls24 family envelope stress response protein n=1 Tax=Schumannella soli TaxID=2590779 RepID=A0A506XX17_9MICO|nr:Asp23/Gls24 family envelope stress response protein [Schumannella soli]TPW77444.1 Asp23/Gls24 family envelope stress response protein [Schumannella soli]